MSYNAGTVYSSMVLDLSKYEKNLTKAEKQMQGFVTKMESMGGKMEKAGKGLTTKVTAPILAIGGAGGVMAANFEESLNKVETIADTSVKPIDQIKKEILNLSDDIGVSSSELNEALYQTISATGDTANAVSYIEIASKAAIGGFTDTSTAVDGLTTVMNAYGLEGSDAMQNVSDQMLMAQNFGKTTFGEMASSIGNVIPIASSLGVTTEELFGSVATLTKNGIQTSQAITGLKAAYSNILKPTTQAQKKAAELGIEFSAAELKSKGWAKFLEEISEKTGGNSEDMATLFGSVEALNSVTVLATTGAEDFSEALGAMGESAGATEKAFGTMDKGTKDLFEDTLNKGKNTLIELADIMLPLANKAIEKVDGWIDKFKGLDDQTKENVVKFLGLAAAIGPVLIIGGKVAKAFGPIISIFTKLKGVSTASTAATGLMSGKLAGLATAAKGAIAALGPAALVVGAITVAGIGLYKHLQKDSIPEIELFGDAVSEATKKAVGSFLDLNDKATVALNEMNWSGQAVTSEMVTEITGKFDTMKNQVVTKLKEQHNESFNQMKSHFADSSALTEQEEQAILEKMQTSHSERQAQIEGYNRRIKEIMQTASSEKRALTQAEQEEINSIQSKMVENGIKVLSENELEAKSILARMRIQASEITAKQAAEVVQNSVKQRDRAVNAAEEQYSETVKNIIKQRDELGTISAEQADKLIEEATRQRDEAVAKVEEMHTNIVTEAKEQASEHIDEVDWETGEILSKWESFKAKLTRKWEELKTNASEKWDSIKTAISNSMSNIKSKIDEGINKIRDWNSQSVKSKVFSIVEKVKKIFTGSSDNQGQTISVGANARGTNYWDGGLTWVGEEGPELIDLPKASRVFDTNKSMGIAQSGPPIEYKTENHFHIGSLIGDEYSLKLLERKMSGIRSNENTRIGEEVFG